MDSSPKTIRHPLRITLGYVLAALLWIFFSDRVVYLFIDDPAWLNLVQSTKGMLFVAVTGALLYLLLHRRQAQALALGEARIKDALADLSRRLLDPRASLREVADAVKAQATALTGSHHGFVAIIDPATRDHVHFSLSAMMDPDCRMPAEGGLTTFPCTSQGKYPGLCGEALNRRRGFFTNRPADEPAFGRLPPGHLPVARFMAVPVYLGEEVVGQIAVANGAVPYDEQDLKTLSRLADLFALGIQKMFYERDLQEARRRAEAASRAKSEFLANMSHEIRTPMTAVLGMLELLQESPLEARQKECADIAQSAGENLLRLLNDILDVSRMDAGSLSLCNEPMDLAELLESSVALFGQAAREKHLELHTHLDERLPTLVMGDAVRLRQVLFNLLGNAVKFTPQGRVEVRLDKDDAGDGEDRVGVRLTVADTGVGIAPDMQRRIFDPFTQEDGTYQRRYQGSGLGLTIVQRLTALMGGETTLESEPGAGTRVSVRLVMPVAAAALHAPPEIVAPESARGPALRILLAEDNPVNRTLMVRVLGKRGHQVTCAANGEEALSALARQDFDLIVMDVQMPVMDGLAATRAIRADRSGAFDPGIPILALTAHAMSGDRETILAAGLDAYVAKPVDFDEFFRTLHALVPAQGS
ncbi:ATP-binding protein [Geoalkalibacter halelectricus]|uniref:histidine kinase n=1 Tax=Geoalkalibacter halelectricus TaxID=2847045 RepID=A0ABY5ZFJ2_9BACT|nr:ATP-binding protein [Geoalkalibacter halelectricus]MDO3377874.1 ATP-binding protein [Geoalkalibacter halelectricus]UWZ77942.1 ATP-binding protein [Geoalkalibacter halelectricus]